METLSKVEVQQLLQCWHSYMGPVRSQLDSFDAFVLRRLPAIVRENSVIHANNERRGASHCISFEEVYVRTPSLRDSDGAVGRPATPQECRVRCLSYEMGVFVNVRHRFQDAHGSRDVLYKEVLLCRLPCMVGSVACSLRSGPPDLPRQECPLDPLGFFVVNGVEKVLVSSEHLRPNFPFVRKVAATGSYHLEIRCLSPEKTRSTSTLNVTYAPLAAMRQSVLAVSLPFVDAHAPAYAVLRMLGVASAAEAAALVMAAVPEDCAVAEGVAAAVERAMDGPVWDMPVEAVMEAVAKDGTKEATPARRARYLSHILTCEFAPQQGLDDSPETRLAKCQFFGMALAKLLRVALGDLPEDDRDDFAIKRVDDAGMLFALLFRQLYRGFLKALTLQAHRTVEAGKYLNVMESINPKKITAGFRYALSTGNWGVMKQATQSGVAQLMARQNIVASVSHRRRCNTPLAREGKLKPPRELSASHYGILCPAETPEGQACGLVENLSFLALVRDGVDGPTLARALRRRGLLRPRASGRWRVLVNGTYEGDCSDGEAAAEALRRARRSAQLPASMSVCSCARQRLLLVDCDAGCLMRPVMRADAVPLVRELLRTEPPPLLWRALIASGAFEVLDKMEERNAPVGSTHRDLHPSCMLGVCAAQIPFLNHNQAPRNVYESAMCKQAVGVSALNAEERLDAISHSLRYPQVPLVQTMLQTAQGADVAPCGVNVIVAICSYGGYNQEDAIIVNRGALERGLFRSSVARIVRDEERAIGTESERFALPPEGAAGRRSGDYSALGPDGLPCLGAVLRNGDVAVGKVLRSHPLGERSNKRRAGSPSMVVDHSTVLRCSEPMAVQRVLLASVRDDLRLCRVCLAASRQPEIGDKFSSHHGQKGVIGAVLDEADMPFLADGTVVDMVVSPLSVPSRMTVAQLMESLLGKAACLEGRLADGTPFEGVTADELGAELARHGYESRGNERLYNGVTGAPLETTVFVGPVHYQRLRHCVLDKVHARARGPMTVLTRQPVEGRSRNGSARLGEMERDILISHGASALLVERLMKSSDAFRAPVCRRCGLLAESLAEGAPFAPPQRRLWCRSCRLGGDDNVAMVEMPYALKLLVQEAAALNIAMRLRVEDVPEETEA